MSQAYIKWYRAEMDVMPPAVQVRYLYSFKQLHPDIFIDTEAAIEAYNIIVEGNICSPLLLAPLHVAALSSRRHLWGLASELIGKLALNFDSASQLILELLSEKSWNPRFTALCCIQKKTSRVLMLKVIGASIDDRSGEVRWKAAQQAEHFCLVELIPQIETALAAEKNEKVLDSLKFSIALLGDGYVSEVSDDGDLCLAVRYSKCLSGGTFRKGEWEGKDLHLLAQEVRDNLEAYGCHPPSSNGGK